MKHWNERGPGLLLCLCIAIPCWMLGRALPVIGGAGGAPPGRPVSLLDSALPGG